eukprot:gene33725-43583_t
MIGDVRNEAVEDLTIKNRGDIIHQSRPTSTRNGSGRRAPPVTDGDVDLILASRVQKISIDIPPIHMSNIICYKDLPSKQSSRLRVLILDSSPACCLDRKDFLHLLGETNGKQYYDCGRPELEIHSIRLAERAHSLLIPAETEVLDGSIPMLLQEIKSVSFIFDPAKQVYVLSDQVQSVLLMCMSMYVRDPRRVIDALALTSAECKALREYFEPILLDAVFVEAAVEASSNLDGCLPDHRAEEAVSGPDQEAEEAEVDTAAAASASSGRRGAGRKPHPSSSGRRDGPLQANLTQPRAVIAPRPISGSPTVV